MDEDAATDFAIATVREVIYDTQITRESVNRTLEELFKNRINRISR